MYRQNVTLFMAPFWGLEFELVPRFFLWKICAPVGVR